MLLEQVLFWDKVKRKPIKRDKYGQTVWKMPTTVFSYLGRISLYWKVTVLKGETEWVQCVNGCRPDSNLGSPQSN